MSKEFQYPITSQSQVCEFLKKHTYGYRDGVVNNPGATQTFINTLPTVAETSNKNTVLQIDALLKKKALVPKGVWILTNQL